MSNTRRKLTGLLSQVDESMGQRVSTAPGNVGITSTQPQFSPVPSQKDIGRQPARSFGTLHLDRVMPDPDQPRRVFADEELSRLADSLRQTGQLHPIRVRWNETQQKWIIISGERRYRAAKLANLKTIDCYFQEDDLTTSATLEQQLVENLQREDLNPLEEATAYDQLMQINNWNGKQLAASLNVTASRVSRAIALLDLPENVQQQIQAGALPATTAYELTKISDLHLLQKLANQAVSGSVTQREVAAASKYQRKQKRRSSTGVKLTFLADNGIRVQVQSPRRQNYHEVLEALQQAIDDVQLRINNNIFI